MQYAYTLAWTRDDGGLISPRFIDDGKGGLLIRNVKSEDIGRYRCTGSNFYTTAEDYAELTVEGKWLTFFTVNDILLQLYG